MTPVYLPIGLRFSSGWPIWLALIFAPTAAVTGMLAQMMHMVVSLALPMIIRRFYSLAFHSLKRLDRGLEAGMDFQKLF
jgi:hypothetical protein